MEKKKYETFNTISEKEEYLVQNTKNKNVVIILILLFMFFIIVFFKNIKPLNIPKIQLNNSENITSNLTNNEDKKKDENNTYKPIDPRQIKVTMKKKYIPDEYISQDLNNSFLNYKNQTNIKNNKFDESYITTQFIEEKLKELYSKNKSDEQIKDINTKIKKVLNETKNMTENIIYIYYFKKYPYDNNFIKFFKFREKPIISIVIPIYNSQKTLNILYKSIQEQSLKELEIIFVDDCSQDDSVKMIENFQRKDQRIILLKNKYNRGPFYSRNKGALFARGEYINFIDSDDVFLFDNLEKAYLISKNDNIDIVQYKLIKEYGNYSLLEFKKECMPNSIIFQPEISDNMFYGHGELKQCNYYIYNKLIKREIVLKSLIYMGEEALNQNLYMHEDALQLFCLLRVANSFYYLNVIGYAKLKIKNTKSLQRSYNSPLYANKVFHNVFTEMKVIFYRTQNNSHDKYICYEFFKMVRSYYTHLSPYVTEGFELFDEVFNLFLNCEYFNNQTKLEIENFRNILMNRNSSDIIQKN